MKIEPVASPTNAQQPNSQAQSGRDRAIAALQNSMNANAQLTPVQNPSQVAPEEMSALSQGKVQNNTSEDSNVASPSPKAEETPLQKSSVDEKALSTQYAQLARREKQLYAKAQAQQEALKAREAAIAAREAEIAAQANEYKSNYIPKSRLQEDTITTLLENGVSYDQITQAMLNQPGQDPATKVALAKLQARIDAQDEAAKQRDVAAQNAQAEAYQQAVRQIRADAKALVSASPEFEAIRKTNSIKDVVELIEETFKEDGVILSVDEACREVESYLVEKLSSYSSNIDKVRQRLQASASSKTQQSQPAQSNSQKQPTPTLTNAVGTGRKLSARERALLAFEGKLQK